MYIKYLGNIHKIEKYFSVVKGDNNCIFLMKEDSHLALKFKNEDSRDYILNKIWEELVNETKCLNLDQITEDYYIANKYNL
jgi:hypothetical protein